MLVLDDVSKRIFDIIGASKEKKVRETAATILLGLDTQDRAEKLEVERSVLKLILERKDLENEEFSKLLELVDMNAINRTTINQLFKVQLNNCYGRVIQ